jgi:hypothetical protein
VNKSYLLPPDCNYISHRAICGSETEHSKFIDLVREFQREEHLNCCSVLFFSYILPLALYFSNVTV